MFTKPISSIDIIALNIESSIPLIFDISEHLVPIKDFGNGKVLWQGLLFTLALLGKIGVGFLVPNFSQGSLFKGEHFSDCLIVGFSMMAGKQITIL